MGRSRELGLDRLGALGPGLGVGHGTPPSTPGFGAHLFGTAGVTDHDHYLAPGTQSLANITDIVVGRPDLVR